MIYRGSQKKKMGINFSKKKDKERKEGLMTQMKDKTEMSPPPPSPPPPPRGLQGTLTSTYLYLEFQTFLRQLDLATSGHHDDSGLGEEDSGERVTSLNFLREIRRLEEMNDPMSRQILTIEIGDKFFPIGHHGNGLMLENNQLWNRCAEACRTRVLTKQGLEDLHKAHDSVLPELDDLHLLFLHQREEQSCVRQIISCIL